MGNNTLGSTATYTCGEPSTDYRSGQPLCNRTEQYPWAKDMETFAQGCILIYKNDTLKTQFTNDIYI